MRWCLVALLAACGGPVRGELTHSVCPTASPPSYADFGQAFFQSYCLDCHSLLKTGADRNKAPAAIDFDTRSDVRMNASNIDKQAAWGPDAMNTIMPPAGKTAPTDAERTRLGEYIACEVDTP